MDEKVLHKDFGQCIITAAFVDDILSLILFNMLFSVTSGAFSIVDVVIKPIVGCVWMLVFGSMGMWFWPPAVRKMTLAIPSKAGGTLNRADEALLLLLFVLLLGYGAFTFV
jgi:Kef-type K+ transport system membrane component KefB